MINETVATLTESLQEELVITAAVIVLFLLHFRASLIVAVTLPMAVLMSFIGMRWFQIDANIMSLAGIAIAIGEVADLGIIISENIYQHLVEWGQARTTEQTDFPDVGSSTDPRSRTEVIIDATYEVAPAVMTGVSTTIVSFLPVFFLTGRDFKLFSPLAWTKTFAMFAALLVAVLLVPALCRLLLHSSRWPWRRVFVVALMAGIAGAAATFLFAGPRFADLLPFPIVVTASLTGLLVGLTVVWMARERLRPIEENPTSRAILSIYEPVLRFLLAHKFSFLAVPITIMLLGAGAWLGLPMVLYPLEQAARVLGAEPNQLPGYVDLKHRFRDCAPTTGLRWMRERGFTCPRFIPLPAFHRGSKSCRRRTR